MLVLIIQIKQNLKERYCVCMCVHVCVCVCVCVYTPIRGRDGKILYLIVFIQYEEAK